MSGKSLRLSVTVVDLKTSVTRVVPAAEVGCILLTTAAYLDTTGLFTFKGETLNTVDTSRFTMTKPLTEGLTTVDLASLAHTKLATDSVTATDVAVRGIALSKTESLTATDTNALAFTFGTVQEPLAATDSSALDIQPSKGDSVTMSDSAVAVLIFLRDVFDTVTATDLPAILFSTPYVETLTATDTNSYVFNQYLTDAFGLNDLADIGDGIAFEFVDFTANVVTIADNQTLQVSSTYSDTISLSDAGVGSLQDYCDITYFAEDYVGSRFTF